jgi:hypothetical protein
MPGVVVHGARFTAGQTELLDNVPSKLDHRIDYVFYQPRGIEAVAAEVVGEELDDPTAAGLWPSDHAGVVATLHLAQPWRRGVQATSPLRRPARPHCSTSSNDTCSCRASYQAPLRYIPPTCCTTLSRFEANYGDIAVVGAECGLADLQGPLEVGTASVQGVGVDMCEPGRLLNSFWQRAGPVVINPLTSVLILGVCWVACRLVRRRRW